MIPWITILGYILLVPLILFSKNWMEMANKEIGKLMCGFAGIR